MLSHQASGDADVPSIGRCLVLKAILSYLNLSSVADYALNCCQVVIDPTRPNFRDQINPLD